MSQDKFTIKYIIPENLKDFHTNGAYISATPSGDLNIHFYSERMPIPKETVHKKNSDGVVQPNPKTHAGCDVVRSIQASIVVDLNTAKAIRDLIDSTIKGVEGGNDGSSS